ncbi:MAG: hypothetical protein IJ710_08075 [Prevotella sp.]|nr:hypothetical protein [Prevotella sp.]
MQKKTHLDSKKVKNNLQDSNKSVTFAPRLRENASVTTTPGKEVWVSG